MDIHEIASGLGDLSRDHRFLLEEPKPRQLQRSMRGALELSGGRTELPKVVIKGEEFWLAGAEPDPDFVPDPDNLDVVAPSRRALLSTNEKTNKWVQVGWLYSDGRVEMWGVSRPWSPSMSRPSKGGGGKFKALKVTETSPDGVKSIKFYKPERLERMLKYAKNKRNLGYEVVLTKLSSIPQIENELARAKRQAAGEKLTVDLL